MNRLDRLRQQLKLSSGLGLITINSLLVIIVWFLLENSHVDSGLVLVIGLVLAAAAGLAMSTVIVQRALAPLGVLWQAVMHLSPNEQGAQAPDISKLKTGRELVAGLTGQIYQFATLADREASEQKRQVSDLRLNFLAQNLPLPLFVLDASENIVFANTAAGQYIGIDSQAMTGKNVYMVLDMSFPNEDTFDKWLKASKAAKAIASGAWERVRLNIRDNHPERLFDLAAYYNRDNPDHHETILVLFDHTKQYSQDEQAVSYIALSVHELRTPLTLLRGYIEVFEEELGTNINPELLDFMQKMRSQAEQLTAFVNNILNVARVEADQLELKLQSEDWPTLLKKTVEMMSLRAKVRGIKLECRIIGELPPVGADSLSMREVLSNLIDNAIKYSGNSKVIKIETKVDAQGQVATSVQDFGVGIPVSVMPNIFTKFYRDHRNRAQIGGTGLGLYLSKAIIGAHGGILTVNSHEGQGSTFSFTLRPYSQLAEEQKKSGERGITRSASGWVKNHSLYRG